jgi:uncharacterized protein YfbU (UPF0304 family)
VSSPFNEFERLSLALQYETLALVDPSNSDAHVSNANLLREGFEADCTPQAFGLSESIPSPESGYVRQILQMFRAISDALAPLRPAQRERLDDRYIIKFGGFDANSEYEFRLLRYAEFLFGQGMYPESAAEVSVTGNSHCPMTGHYDRMLARWRSLPEPYEMTVRDAIWVGWLSTSRAVPTPRNEK